MSQTDCLWFSFSKPTLLVRWGVMIIENYGNMNIDSLLFIDQRRRRELTEVMPCRSPSLRGRRKIQGESKANRKRLSKTCFSGRVEVISQELEMQKNWKQSQYIPNIYFMFWTALGNGAGDRKNWGNLIWGVWFRCWFVCIRSSEGIMKEQFQFEV